MTTGTTTDSGAVTLPTTVGDVSYFVAHGHRWRLCRLNCQTWTLRDADLFPGGRTRFGSRSQICEDIDHILTTGALPKSNIAQWA